MARVELTTLPASGVPWEDLQELFGTTRDTRCCQCQRWKIGRWEWTPVPVEARVTQMRAETHSEPSSGGRHVLLHPPGFWRRGVSAALAAAAVEHARRHGARAVQGYPMVQQPGKVVTWGELFAGSRNALPTGGTRR